MVEVADDGRGIDVLRDPPHRGGARPDGGREALEAMDDAEAINLIFAPGFSTAAAVTDLSGRGVGMNAVRSAVE